MSLKIVFVLVSAAALCCAQTDSTSSSGFPAKEAPAPIIAPPASPPETNQNPPGPASQPAPTDQPAPALHAAPTGDQPAPSGKGATEGRIAGAKPDTGHKGYIIGPLDVVSIKVWNSPNLSGLVSVDSDGMISLPLIGEIKADGLTQQELRDTITQRLKECCFVNDPDGRVDATVAKVNSKRYFVYGGVGKAGEYPLQEKTTIMDALSLTGGFKDFANQKKIYILRGTQKFNFNYKDVSHGKHMEENIQIENGDRIFVPE